MSDHCKHCDYVASQSDEDLKMLWQCLHAALHVRFPHATQQIGQHLTEEGKQLVEQSLATLTPASMRGAQ